ARAIKSGDDGSRAPAIIMVTAFGREDVRQEAEDARLDGFLVKPVSPSTLTDAIIQAFAPDQEAVRSAGEAVARDYGLAGMKVLLAEDNEVNQQIAIELLEAVGVVVDASDNGQAAVDKLKSGASYDAVLMDLQMPVLDGLAATATIRSDQRFRDLPIIAMTAHAMAEERERCLAAGMNDHVTKPIEPEVLYQTLARWFRRASHAAPAPRGERAAPAAGALPDMTGVDIADGLKRVAGNSALYRSLLAKFVEGQAGTPEAIRGALRDGDRTLAERLAHTLKGVAGNIGARAVQASAGDLERAIRSDAGQDQLLERVETELSTIVGRIRASLPGPAGARAQDGAAPPADPEKFKSVLTRLMGLVAENDGDALDCLNDNAPMLQSGLASGDYAAIEKAL